MGKKILIVDDEVDLLKMFEVVLKKAGYEVSTAVNGSEALEIVKSGQFSLVILDYFLPDMNGQEVFDKLKESVEGKDLPVIFVSASAEKLQEVEGVESSDKFLKPVLPKDLREAAKKHIAEENGKKPS